MSAVVFLILTSLFLAYTNGANDNFKGVATLFGSSTTDYKRALVWAMVTTFAGSMTAVFIGAELIKSFSGKGLVPDAVALDPSFLAAVGCGAALTVLAATRFGFPISTTHAMTGALIGAGLLATGGDVHWTNLGETFFAPLLISPILALLLALVFYPLFRFARVRLGVTAETPIGEVEAGQTSLYSGAIVGINAQQALDTLHYLSAGSVGFARGLNDAPKIVALLFATQALDLQFGLGLVAVAMAAGGLLSARRVAETMSKKITGMNAGQGFTANLVTSILVIGASRIGVPVSTTHVSCGALFGIGAVNRQAQWKMIAQILLAWVTTLPFALAAAALVYLLIGAVR